VEANSCIAYAFSIRYLSILNRRTTGSANEFKTSTDEAKQLADPPDDAEAPPGSRRVTRSGGQRSLNVHYNIPDYMDFGALHSHDEITDAKPSWSTPAKSSRKKGKKPSTQLEAKQADDDAEDCD
jgi:hypothetical protein